MKKLLSCTLTVLLTLPAFAAIQVNRSGGVTVTAPVTPAEVEQAFTKAESIKSKIFKYTISFSQCGDAEVAAVLKKFTDVQRISFFNCPITNLSALKNSPCRYLTLHVIKNPIDLSPVGSCKNLVNLTLMNVNFTNRDLSFVKGLANLTTLHISRWKPAFKSVAGIENCKKVNYVTLECGTGGTNVDIAPLAKLPSVRTLTLGQFKNLDLKAVVPLTRLSTLKLSGSSGFDLSLLKNNTALKSLDLYGVKQIKFAAIGQLKSLERVRSGYTAMSDISWAAQLPRLRSFSSFHENIKDLSPLGRCPNLADLSLRSMKSTVNVAQFADGLGKSKLSSLAIAYSEVINAGKLASLSKTPLRSLNIERVNSKNKQTIDLGFLKGFTKLQRLYLNRTPVSNFQAVGSCTDLTYLDAGCTAFDLATVKKLPKLRTLRVPKAQQKAVAAAFKGTRTRVSASF